MSVEAIKKIEEDRKNRAYERDVKQLNREMQELQRNLLRTQSNVDNKNLSPPTAREELESWQYMVQSTLHALQKKPSEYIWPRDVLFRYLQTMEKLQENMKEHTELQLLAASALHQVCDR
eukprot:TRINITY_DN20768_c0_g1_i4.p1 TRINITY_DN20768_c0_g1~~TRINITY_DN20768_c0_g1_i4.p1  ORF type:complete len:139 (-),score=31.23 TRINITY_DN20768_c0_g1_i4:137-496(-)